MLGPKVLTEQDLFAGSVTAVPVRETFQPARRCRFVRRHASSPTLVAQELAGMLVSYSRMAEATGRCRSYGRRGHRPA